MFGDWMSEKFMRMKTFLNEEWLNVLEEMFKQRRGISCITPEKEMSFVVAIPAGHFPHSAWVSCNITLKNSPKRECRIINFPLLSQNFQQPWREEFTRPFMSVSASISSYSSFDPTILSFNFNIYLFLRYSIIYGIVR